MVIYLSDWVINILIKSDVYVEHLKFYFVEIVAYNRITTKTFTRKVSDVNFIDKLFKRTLYIKIRNGVRAIKKDILNYEGVENINNSGYDEFVTAVNKAKELLGDELNV